MLLEPRHPRFTYAQNLWYPHQSGSCAVSNLRRVAQMVPMGMRNQNKIGLHIFNLHRGLGITSQKRVAQHLVLPIVQQETSMSIISKLNHRQLSLQNNLPANHYHVMLYLSL